MTDGFKVEAAAPAASGADIVFVLLPDELAPGFYQDELAAALRPGKAIVFASGFNLAFRRICPDLALDVLLRAPRMMGVGIRELYLQGLGFPSFLSVERDVNRQGW